MTNATRFLDGFYKKYTNEFLKENEKAQKAVLTQRQEAFRLLFGCLFLAFKFSGISYAVQLADHVGISQLLTSVKTVANVLVSHSADTGDEEVLDPIDKLGIRT